MGKAETMNRIGGAKRALTLILAAQHMAQPIENNGRLIRPNMLDPAIQMRPSTSKTAGTYFLAAKIAWNEASRKNAAATRYNAHERMTQMRRDIFDPKGNTDDNAHYVTANVNMGNGILLGVGDPLETLQVPTYNPLAPTQRFEGNVNSYEHQLILLAGALVLAEAAELATE
jgi:hypothetical protein